jgi:dTDP-4-dehydrorhamnose reductase
MPAIGSGWRGMVQVPRLLVTGASGQLGCELLARGRARGWAVLGRTRADLDISDRDAVLREVADAGAEAVLNAAAYTAVDLAEQERERAFAVNAAGPGHLAEACAAHGLPLIHVSTDYVFDGTKTGAYREDDPVAPINVYGASKEAGERAVREALPAHVILRTSWVYSSHGRNFVRTMRQLAAERDTLKVVADQHGCPTSAADLAEAMLDVADGLARGAAGHGTFHFAGAGVTSWHGFAAAVMDDCLPPGQTRPLLVPIATTAFPRPAARPANSVLDCRLIGQVWGITPRPWREALADVGRELGAGG